MKRRIGLTLASLALVGWATPASAEEEAELGHNTDYEFYIDGEFDSSLHSTLFLLEEVNGITFDEDEVNDGFFAVLQDTFDEIPLNEVTVGDVVVIEGGSGNLYSIYSKEEHEILTTVSGTLQQRYLDDDGYYEERAYTAFDTEFELEGDAGDEDDDGDEEGEDDNDDTDETGNGDNGDDEGTGEDDSPGDGDDDGHQDEPGDNEGSEDGSDGEIYITGIDELLLQAEETHEVVQRTADAAEGTLEHVEENADAPPPEVTMEVDLEKVEQKLEQVTEQTEHTQESIDKILSYIFYTIITVAGLWIIGIIFRLFAPYFR